MKKEETLQDRILNRLEEMKATNESRSSRALRQAATKSQASKLKAAQEAKDREDRILAGKKKADKKKEAVRQANIINNPK